MRTFPTWLRQLAFFLFVFMFGISVSGCQTNPYTKRSQLLLVNSAEMQQMASNAYNEVLSDPKVIISKDPREIEPVKRVAARIIEAAKRSKYAEAAKQFHWEVSVIKDDQTKNAWAMPGGKIAVYTGIFPIAKTEAGLAAIMGHEVVHALAQHGGERMSQGMLAQFGQAGTAVALAVLGVNPEVNQLAMQAVGLGTQVGILLPFSRQHESEADYIGVLLAADAGYDPREAIAIWQRMAGASDGAPPEFLSTHPAHDTRIADLKKWMPEAMTLYQSADKAPVKNLPTLTPSAKPPSDRPSAPKTKFRR
ncbi:MAG: M48 family metallopeptidase [Nitrospirales bacterium]|nr:M48 family metallopeptidase [Nitrospirales bacterium]